MSRYVYRYVPVISPLYRAVRRLWQTRAYAGSAVHCVLCRRDFARWLKTHEVPVCPHCRSEPRHRFLWSFLARRWHARDPAVSLLHFAPEWCLQQRFKRDTRLSRYLTIDLAAPNADIHADITATGLKGSSFDAIICCHVLEHIIDDRAAMRELHRLLRPGGVAYIQVPCNERAYETDEDPAVRDPRERERRFGQFDHVRLYGLDIVQRLQSAGFRVTQRRPGEILDAEQMTTRGIYDDVLFECEKRQTATPRAAARGTAIAMQAHRLAHTH